ncbi:MAG: FGGY-family carbohydrate kinase [Microthrixaceae bacterium]|nr:FGGY-family carbohydrate kinase [Microthrixaceae bacterium]
MNESIVLAVDLGTGGPKVALVSLGGEIVDSVHQRVEPRVSASGAALQDPAEWWQAVSAGTRELVAGHPEQAAAMVAVAVTGQWGSTVPADPSGEATGDCMLWMDCRGGAHAKRVLGGRVAVEGFKPRSIVEWIRRSGGAPSTEGNDPLGHRLWIQHEEPDLYRRTAVFLEPLDYLNARFCGRVAASQTSMLLSWLTDNRRLGQVEYDPLLVKLAATDPGRLPPLVATGSTVGTVTSTVSSELGIPAGVPVLTALPDLLSATLGSGAIGMYETHLSISTSAWVGCHTPTKRTSIAKQMATVPSALGDRYVLANNHETAGVCMEWARNLLVEADDGLTEAVRTSLADLDDVASTVASGSGGVLFAPWLNGERSPVADADLRGGFHNMSLSTTRADLVRSVLEGVAHNNRWLLEESEQVLKQPLSALRVIGGGAQSDLWCQIHADVLGRPLRRVAQPLLANVRGAAFFAGLSLGLMKQSEVAARVEIERTFEPDPGSREVHDAMHREFVRLHRIERGMYRRLAKLR